jgi:hypothetical protein
LLYNGIHYDLGVIVVAKSKAKKLREKLEREGKMNPEIKRSPFVLADMRTRTTKTKKDHIYQFKNKNHRFQDGNDGSIFFVDKYKDIPFYIHPLPSPLYFYFTSKTRPLLYSKGQLLEKLSS